MKDSLKKITLGSVESWLARLFSCYRVTPQSTTGVCSAQLIFGRKLRTRLDLLQPDLGCKVRQQQAKQKQNHDVHSKQRGFEVGTTVYVFNNHGTPKWLPGTSKQITGPASVLVKLSDGCPFRRHIDNINVRSTQDFHDVNLDANICKSKFSRLFYSPITDSSTPFYKDSKATESLHLNLRGRIVVYKQTL